MCNTASKVLYFIFRQPILRPLRLLSSEQHHAQTIHARFLGGQALRLPGRTPLHKTGNQVRSSALRQEQKFISDYRSQIDAGASHGVRFIL